MLDFEDFKDIVEAEFMNYVPENLKHMEMRTCMVNKINIQKYGINLIDKSGKLNVSPTVYMEDMYKAYCSNGDLQETLKEAAQFMSEKMEILSETTQKFDFSTAKDNIIFQLINREQNKEMLKDMPYREFNDLAIIYRWVIGKDEMGELQSAIITNPIAHKIGMNEAELFKAASENTKSIMKPEIVNINDIIKEILLGDKEIHKFEPNMPQELFEEMFADITEQVSMWVVTNSCRNYGASSMLYEDMLNGLAKKLDSDLYIIPSSLHEVIAVPADFIEPNDLAAMVADTNMAEVEPEDRLSNQVYYYDRDLRKITLATDTPNKRLDGIVAEPEPVYGKNNSAR